MDSDDATDQGRIADVKSKRDVVERPVADHARAFKDQVVEFADAEHVISLSVVQPV